MWPCAVKNEGDRNLHLDLRGFTLTVRTPQCDTLFGEKYALEKFPNPWKGIAVIGMVQFSAITF